MVDDAVRKFCLWLGWRPAASDQTYNELIRRLVAEGHTPEQALALLDAIEEAEIDEFMAEKFPPVKPKS